MATLIGTVKGNKALPHWFTLTSVEESVVLSGGSSSQATVDDQLVTTVTGATVGQRYLLSVDLQYERNVTVTPYTVTYVSSNESVATVDANGVVSYVADGSVTITCNLVDGGQPVSRGVDLVFAATAGSVETIKAGIANSARKDAEDGVDDLISGLTASVSKPIFTTQDAVTPSYVRNTQCWAHGLTGMTAISPWNSLSSGRRAGVAITARHVIYAAHYPLQVGATLRFIAADNTVVDRTVSAVKSSSNYGGSSDRYRNDYGVALLDSDLPASIGSMKLLSSDWEDYFPTGNSLLPLLVTDFSENALVKQGKSYDSDYWYGGVIQPSYTDRVAFTETIISGDSGNPNCLVIDGELVLVAVTTFGGNAGGTNLSAKLSDINQLITDVDALGGVSTGYTLTTVDLSGYTDFS